MGKTDERDFKEKRESSRKSCFFIEVDYSIYDDIYTDPVRDISTTGVFVETDRLMPVGDRVNLLFSDFSRVDLIKVAGDVISSNKDGFAVSFHMEAEGQRTRLADYVCNL